MAPTKWPLPWTSPITYESEMFVESIHPINPPTAARPTTFPSKRDSDTDEFAQAQPTRPPIQSPVGALTSPTKDDCVIVVFSASPTRPPMQPWSGEEAGLVTVPVTWTSWTVVEVAYFTNPAVP
jgi:hypothetical protein